MNVLLKFAIERVIFLLQFIVLLIWSIIKIPFPVAKKDIAGQIALVSTNIERKKHKIQ
jgi:multisubunit Na+/H+ antiporter MnhE subunit